MQYSGIASAAARYTRGMTVAKGFFYLAVSLLAAVLLAGLYLLYKNTQTLDAVSIDNLVKGQIIRKEGPAACVGSWSGFDSAGSVVVYIADNKFRIDATLVKLNKPIVFHLVGDATGSKYAWGDSQQVPLSPEDITLPELFSNEQIPCDPWWFADMEIFTAPPSITENG